MVEFDGRAQKLSRRVKSFPVSPLVGLVVYTNTLPRRCCLGLIDRRQKGSAVTSMMMGGDGFSESDAGNHAASSSELFFPRFSLSLSLSNKKKKKVTAA